jgi:hypothetical protein
MIAPIQPAGSGVLRLTSGFEVLDRWSQDADQSAQTVVYEVIFAVAERSVFSDYVVVDDTEKATEFFVLARCGLAVKFTLHSLESCGIVYIGPAADAPGLDRMPGRAASPGEEAAA